MLETLDLVNDVAEQYPPESGHESRFGNPAFRKFYDQVGLVGQTGQKEQVFPNHCSPTKQTEH